MNLQKSTSVEPSSQKKSSQFLFYLEEFNKFLVDIIDKKVLVTLSLKELSTLQSVKSLLDQTHYLNLVYHENSKIKYNCQWCFSLKFKIKEVFHSKDIRKQSIGR